MLLGTPESLLDQPRPLRLLSKEVGPCSNPHMPLWQMPNDVTYCQQLPTVQAGRGLQRLHSADDIATEWLKTYGSTIITAVTIQPESTIRHQHSHPQPVPSLPQTRPDHACVACHFRQQFSNHFQVNLG